MRIHNREPKAKQFVEFVGPVYFEKTFFIFTFSKFVLVLLVNKEVKPLVTLEVNNCQHF